MDKDIKVTLKVWRQRGPKEKGKGLASERSERKRTI